MADSKLTLPSRKLIQEHILKSLTRYWTGNIDQLLSLPVVDNWSQLIECPLKLQVIQLPDWGVSSGVNGQLLVPVEACQNGDDWQQVDWWFAAFLLLECWHERVWELEHNEPVHSYSLKLHGWDERAWSAAWVNRIALFLREWAAYKKHTSPKELFGVLAAPEIFVTHDVDAVAKTVPIRLKQGVFNLFNAVRHALKGELRNSSKKLCAALKFLFSKEEWWVFDYLLEIEKKHGIHSQFNFYTDKRKKTFMSWLLDPGYSIEDSKLKKLFKKIAGQGSTIGLHPTFDAWCDSKLIQEQREWLSVQAGQSIHACRQHWLRFGWMSTWSAQESAGIKKDSTLMFNDRPGYRTAAAIEWRPWNERDNRPHELEAMPTVLMDSHFYDYRTMNSMERKNEINYWLNECKEVGGQVAVLWHPHTLTRDYGWKQGFNDLVSIIIRK